MLFSDQTYSNSEQIKIEPFFHHEKFDYKRAQKNDHVDDASMPRNVASIALYVDSIAMLLTLVLVRTDAFTQRNKRE